MSRDDEYNAWATVAVPQLLRLSRVMAADRQVAEDLVQETLVSIYVKWPRILNPDAYARQTLSNYVTSFKRSAARRKEDLRDDFVDEISAVSTDITGATVTDSLQLLSQLPQQQRAVLALRYLDDMAVNDIACTLEITAGSVRTYLARGLASLRKQVTAANMFDS